MWILLVGLACLASVPEIQPTNLEEIYVISDWWVFLCPKNNLRI